MRTFATDPPHVTPLPPTPTRVRVSFDRDSVEMNEVHGTLELARLATESLHGQVAVALDAEYGLDGDTVWIDSATAVGRSLALLFVGYCEREFGSRAIRVERAAAAVTAHSEGRAER